jgi:hypothetical protein
MDAMRKNFFIGLLLFDKSNVNGRPSAIPGLKPLKTVMYFQRKSFTGIHIIRTKSKSYASFLTGEGEVHPPLFYCLYNYKALIDTGL